MYSMVRIKSILTRFQAAHPDAKLGTILPPESKKETDLALALCRFNEAVEEATPRTPQPALPLYLRPGQLPEPVLRRTQYHEGTGRRQAGQLRHPHPPGAAGVGDLHPSAGLHRSGSDVSGAEGIRAHEEYRETRKESGTEPWGTDGGPYPGLFGGAGHPAPGAAGEWRVIGGACSERAVPTVQTEPVETKPEAPVSSSASTQATAATTAAVCPASGTRVMMR